MVDIKMTQKRYANKRNALQLTAVMMQTGIMEVVVCPGSRNALLVHDFAEAGMTLHEVTDERSAGFYAIGLIESRQKPVAVCCTSGSAVLNLAPAVSEAFYQQLPLMVITADRPERWIGQMDGQTLPQAGVFGTMVHKSVQLPEVGWDDDDALNREQAIFCNRLINEAILKMRITSGPVHINVQLSEPLFDFTRESLPQERIIELMRSKEEALAMKQSLSRRMLIVGQLREEEAKAVARCLRDDRRFGGWVIVCEYLSNLQACSELEEAGLIVVSNADEIVRTQAEDTLTASLLAPEVVVTVGGHIVSKRLKQWLRRVRPLQHWHQSVIAEVADLFLCSTRVMPVTVVEGLAWLNDAMTQEPDFDYLETWRRLSERKKAEGHEALSEVLQYLDKSWHLQVANSSMVRYVQLVGLPHGNVVSCNRGVNGIEGSVSAAVGYWASGRKTALLIGDLSFFYDQNGLWNNAVSEARQREAEGKKVEDLLIVMMNNGGGEIFRHLPGLETSPYRDRMVAGAHRTTAQGVAETMGLEYRLVTRREELAGALTNHGKMTLIEIVGLM